jgi:hypothetical protein
MSMSHMAPSGAFFAKEKSTFKKNVYAAEQDRPDIAAERQRFRENQAHLDRASLVLSTKSGRRPT